MGFHEKPYENEVFWWKKGCVCPLHPLDLPMLIFLLVSEYKLDIVMHHLPYQGFHEILTCSVPD